MFLFVLWLLGLTDINLLTNFYADSWSYYTAGRLTTFFCVCVFVFWTCCAPWQIWSWMFLSYGAVWRHCTVRLLWPVLCLMSKRWRSVLWFTVPSISIHTKHWGSDWLGYRVHSRYRVHFHVRTQCRLLMGREGEVMPTHRCRDPSRGNKYFRLLHLLLIRVFPQVCGCCCSHCSGVLDVHVLCSVQRSVCHVIIFFFLVWRD